MKDRQRQLFLGPELIVDRLPTDTHVSRDVRDPHLPPGGLVSAGPGGIEDRSAKMAVHLVAKGLAADLLGFLVHAANFTSSRIRQASHNCVGVRKSVV